MAHGTIPETRIKFNHSGGGWGRKKSRHNHPKVPKKLGIGTRFRNAMRSAFLGRPFVKI